MVMLTMFIGFVALAGAAFNVLVGGGPIGFAIAMVVAGIAAFVSYWNSDTIALRMARAVPADPAQYKRLHNLVEGLCISSGLPKPRLYVVNDPAPNAFATGRNPQHAAVAVTTGLLEQLNRVELEGVIAHELSHVKNYDMLVMTLTVTMVGIVAMLADIGMRMLWFGGGRRGRGGGNGGNVIVVLLSVAFLALAPLAARALQAAVGRGRESLADVSAVEMTRYPPGLISALEKLRDDTAVVANGSRATAHLWIEEPVQRIEGATGKQRLASLFNTHPPLEERIAALREL